jgi:hypothetical protein
MKRCTLTNKVWYSEISWAYPQILLQPSYFLKLLKIAMVRNIEVMLGHTEPLCVEFCNVLQCHTLVNDLTFILINFIV